MYNFLVLNFGYVESWRVATLILKNQYNSFKTPEEALEDYATEVLEIFKIIKNL